MEKLDQNLQFIVTGIVLAVLAIFLKRRELKKRRAVIIATLLQKIKKDPLHYKGRGGERDIIVANNDLALTFSPKRWQGNHESIYFEVSGINAALHIREGWLGWQETEPMRSLILSILISAFCRVRTIQPETTESKQFIEIFDAVRQAAETD